MLCLSAWPLQASAAPADLRSICLDALGGRTGAVVLLEVRSGKVLAGVPEDWSRRRLPPGSVAKLVTAWAGLSTGAISEGTRFTCSNALTVNGRSLHCTVPGGHGTLDLEHAIGLSCNVWFYQAARRIGQEAILRAWRELGASEVPQRVESAERLAVGEEGVRVSCLEAARIVRRIALGRRNERAMCAVARGMRSAVTGGTAHELAATGLSVAGKTGSPGHTANPNLRHGWFAGFAPYHNPQVCIAVFCLEGNAYRSAVPVAAKALKGYFATRAR